MPGPADCLKWSAVPDPPTAPPAEVACVGTAGGDQVARGRGVHRVQRVRRRSQLSVCRAAQPDEADEEQDLS